MAEEKIDLATAQDAVLELIGRLQQVNGKTIPPASRAKDRIAVLAPIRTELLYLSHLCDVARVEIMDVYHGTRGNAPTD